MPARQITVWLSEIYTVEQVEDICAELERKSIDLELLWELSIEVRKPRPDVGVLPAVSLVAESRSREC